MKKTRNRNTMQIIRFAIAEPDYFEINKLPPGVEGNPELMCWKELCRTGTYIAGGTEHVIDDAFLQNIVDIFFRRQAKGIEVPCPVGHCHDPEKRRGQVRFVELRKNEEGGTSLYGIIEFVDAEAKRKLMPTSVSIEAPEIMEDGDGEKHYFGLEHVAFTDYPVVAGMEPFEDVVFSIKRSRISMGRKWSDLSDRERKDFHDAFYRIWKRTFKFKPDTDSPEPWGAPWEWEKNGNATTPDAWFRQNRREIERLNEEYSFSRGGNRMARKRGKKFADDEENILVEEMARRRKKFADEIDDEEIVDEEVGEELGDEYEDEEFGDDFEDEDEEMSRGRYARKRYARRRFADDLEDEEFSDDEDEEFGDDFDEEFADDVYDEDEEFGDEDAAEELYDAEGDKAMGRKSRRCGRRFSLSRGRGINFSLLRDNRNMKIDSLVRSGFITPQQSRFMRREFCNDHAIQFSLESNSNRDFTKVCQLLEMAVSLDFADQFNERSGAQFSIERNDGGNALLNEIKSRHSK